MAKLANYLRIEKQDSIYTLFMTPELQEDIGTVGFIEFSKVTHLNKDDVIAAVEASKTVLDLISPISGQVVAYNLAAVDTPTLLNSVNPTENWLVQLTQVDAATYDSLPEV